MLLRNSTDPCCCILETATKLRAFDEAPYTSSAVMLAALVRHAQLQLEHCMQWRLESLT